VGYKNTFRTWLKNKLCSTSNGILVSGETCQLYCSSHLGKNISQSARELQNELAECYGFRIVLILLDRNVAHNYTYDSRTVQNLEVEFGGRC
jgi:hypothetical protein